MTASNPQRDLLTRLSLRSGSQPIITTERRIRNLDFNPLTFAKKSTIKALEKRGLVQAFFYYRRHRADVSITEAGRRYIQYSQ
jgi:hypothetical protein